MRQELRGEDRIDFSLTRSPYLPNCKEGQYNDAGYKSADDDAAGPFVACTAFLEGKEERDEPAD